MYGAIKVIAILENQVYYALDPFQRILTLRLF